MTHDFHENGEWFMFATSAKWSITTLDSNPKIGYPHVVFNLHLKVHEK